VRKRERLTERARTLSHTLVGWPSVTGTPDEAAFASRLQGLIAEHLYFKANPAYLTLAPIEGDPNGRANVLALVRGSGSRTIILAGHFDVVPVDDYGDLSELAGSPDALREGLIARLEATGGYPQALADLQSGEFVPGRGMLDMKSGVAAGLAVLEQFAESDDRIGNLLLIATPDEEENSAGMRAVSAMLPEFLQSRGLEPVVALNLDATCDAETGQNGRVATFGTIGKVLLSAFVAGKDAHACYPFDGINAAYLAAELAIEFECAPALGEMTGDEVAAPPTALSLKDAKSVYNVTTPGRAWLYWNVLMHRRRPEDIIAMARDLAGAAVSRAASRMKERAASFKLSASPLWDDVSILTFAELRERARAASPNFEAEFDQAAAELEQSGFDLPERSRRLTELALDAAQLPGAAVIIGIASTPYPAIAWLTDEAAARTRKIIEAAMARVAVREKLSVESREFFPAISDISFLARNASASLEGIREQMPLWGSSIRFAEDARYPPIPTVNIGPWGRDYHHFLERTHGDYTFRVLPDLLATVIDDVLRA
jgi:arginine utilization protein RocB